MLIDSHARHGSPRYAEHREAISITRRRASRIRAAAFSLIGFSCFSATLAQNSPPTPNLELRLESSDLKGGVPESFTFVFVNVGSHDIHVPQVGPCSSKESGWLQLQLDYKCVVDPQRGFAGGCGSGMGDGPGILATAKSWEILTPGQSLRVKESRSNMFQNQECPGHYDFWAEYTPPNLSAAEMKTLTDAGVDFPREHLTSNHLTFVKK